MADEIKVEGGLASLLGNIPSNLGTPDNNGGQTEEQKLAAEKAQQEAEAKAKAEAEAKAKGQGGKGTEDKTDDTLTDEQIQAKLTELEAKDESQYTDEEKAFIEKYTGGEESPIDSARKALETKYNVKLEGTFDNSPEGLINLTEAATTLRAKQKIVELLETVPYMKDFYNHVVLEKRSVETFLDKNAQPSFKSIKIEETSDSNDEAKNKAIVERQKQILKMDLKSKGMADDDIENLINLHEDKGSLFTKAKEAYNSLDTRHKASIEAKLQAEEARIKAEEQAIVEEIKKINTMLDSNNFDGVSIPATDIKAFKEAMTKAVDDDGNTILDYKRSKLTLSQRVLIDYLVWKDLKVEGLGKATTSNKKFEFKKKSEDNNNRGGGRIRGGADNFEQNGFGVPFDLTSVKIER